MQFILEQLESWKQRKDIVLESYRCTLLIRDYKTFGQDMVQVDMHVYLKKDSEKIRQN